MSSITGTTLGGEAPATGSHVITYLAAIREACQEEMRRDERVITFGQEVRTSTYGGTAGLVDEFGEERVRSTPIAESVTFGAGVGAALTGLRPIVDVTHVSFIYVGLDQIINSAARSRYMFGGQSTVPVVYRTAVMYGGSLGAQHSDRPHAMLMQIPGLKIVAPATPRDMKGLLKSAVRDDNPVIVFEDATLWMVRGEVGGVDDLVPIGKAAVVTEGADVTVVSVSGAISAASRAVTRLADDGVSAELVDVRSLAPLDFETILGSVVKTGRLVIVDPADRVCSAASEIAAVAVEEVFESLKAPIVRVTAPGIPIPSSPRLEQSLYPTEEKVVDAVRRVLEASRRTRAAT